MKLAVFAILIALCLAVATAEINNSVEEDELLDEFAPLGIADDITDEDDFSVFGILWFTIFGTLRTLKGVNCSIRRVMSIQSAGVTFLNDFKGCTSSSLKDVNALTNQVQTVVDTSNDIIHLNSNICHNGALDDQADGKKVTPLKCFFKLLSKVVSLKKQIGKTINLSKRLTSVPGKFGSCNLVAAKDLVSVFTQFPSYVKTCSKLTR